MKKFIAIVSILGAIFLLLGLLLAGVAYFTGGVDAFSISSKDVKTLTEKSVSFSESIDKVDLDTQVGDVEFHEYDGDEIRVDYSETDKVTYTITCEDGALKVRQSVDKNAFFDFLSSGDRYWKMDIYLPKDSSDLESGTIHLNTGALQIPAEVFFKDLDVDLDTGSVKISGSGEDSKAGTYKIKDNTGSVKLDNLQVEKITVTNNTGSMTLSNFDGEEIDLKDSTGSINLENVHGGDLTLKNNTGSINLTTVEANTINAKGSTGSIKFDQVKADSVTGETNTGSIRGSLIGDYNYQASSNTGSVHVPESAGTAKASFKSNTGSVKIEKI